MIFTILLQRGPTLFSRFISGLQEDGQDQHKELALKLVHGQSMHTSVTPRPSPRAKKRVSTPHLITNQVLCNMYYNSYNKIGLEILIRPFSHTNARIDKWPTSGCLHGYRH